MVATKILAGKIAVVPAGSRRCGRGFALALGDAGATVYVKCRTTRDGPCPSMGLPARLRTLLNRLFGSKSLLEEQCRDQRRTRWAGITARDGIGIPARVDHTDPFQVKAMFDLVARDQGIWISLCAPWWRQ